MESILQETNQDVEQTDLPLLVIQLHQARLAEAEATKKLKTAEDAVMIKFRTDNADLVSSASGATTNREAAEAALREAVVNKYKITKLKSFSFGLCVQVKTKLVYDTKVALDWCRENAKVCIIPESLDAKKFDSLCTDEKIRPEFVTTEDIVSAKIPTDLSKFIIPQVED